MIGQKGVDTIFYLKNIIFEDMKKFIILLLFLNLTGLCSAITLGAGPSSLEFLNVNKGGYAEQNLVVYTDSEENLTIRIEATGPISEWLTFNETTFILPAGGRVEIHTKVEPPVVTPNGLYNGRIHFQAALQKEAENSTTFPTKAGTSILATIGVTGEKRYNYKINSILVKDIEVEYPVKINISVTNTGNIDVVPQLFLTIRDDNKKIILQENYSDSEITPTTTREIQIELENISMDPGLYWIEITWDLGGKQEISLEVLEKGALAIYGKLTSITIDKHIVQEDDVVRIDGTLVNAGEEFIDTAVFKVEVYSTSEKSSKNKLEELVESEPYSIPVGSERQITSYFTPEKAGKYLLRGYVVYSGKKTRVKDVELEVLEKAKNYLLHYILLGIVFIIISYYLFRKKPKEFVDPRTKTFQDRWGGYLGG